MLDQSRQRAVLPSQVRRCLVHVIGCGNLGSALAIALVRSGVWQIHLWDHDIVDPANLATQQYAVRDLRRNKAVSLANTLIAIDPDVYAVPLGRFDGTADLTLPPQPAVVIAATDNMEARRAVWLAVRTRIIQRGPAPLLFVDPRMAFEDFTIWAIRAVGDDSARDEYEALLLDETQTYDAGTCGATSVGATGMGVAGLCLPIIRRWLNNVSFPKLIIGDFGTAQFRTYWREDEPMVDEMEVLQARIAVAEQQAARNESEI